jgi:DNA-binding CsgD family transcriptional regulator
VVRWHRGDPRGAEADAAAALELRAAVPGAQSLATAALGAALLAGVELGRDGRELEALLASHQVDPDLMSYSQVLIGEGALLMSLGRHAEALERYRACDRQETGWGRDCPALVPWRSGAALALVAMGDASAARLIAAEEIALARRAGTPRALGMALRAAAAAVEGDEKEALLGDSVAALEEGVSPLELARALVDLGTARRVAGLRKEARDLLERAQELAQRCGATPLAERAADEIRRSGARPRRTRADGAEPLTPSERRVAELAAEGLSNREIAQALFLSEKTVETHLGSTYRKLGIKSRRRLAAALGDPATAPAPG